MFMIHGFLNKIILDQGMDPISLVKMFDTCEIIYVLAAVTTKELISPDKNLLNKLKKNSCLILMSRAAVLPN